LDRRHSWKSTTLRPLEWSTWIAGYQDGIARRHNRRGQPARNMPPQAIIVNRCVVVARAGGLVLFADSPAAAVDRFAWPCVS
jgi:hypothetical protein